ncbi:hypothetical protein [Palleronia pontilimi]|nr:hypothetical protein [Palleronia pontilimi]
MMDRLVDQVLKMEQSAPFLDRAMLSVGVFSLALSLAGTVLIYA